MMRLCPPPVPVVALALLLVSGTEAGDSFPVRCSKNCRGTDTCVTFCAGEQKQTGKCTPMAACPKPFQNPALCPDGPQPCQFSEWAPWHNDTAKCSGLCMRTRTIARPNMCGGGACNGSLTETKTCTGFCNLIQPQDCTFKLWSAWSACSQNQRSRTRKVLSPPLQGGACEGPTSQTQVCTLALGGNAVAGTDCSVSSWMEWNQCSASCGGGQHIRFRVITQRATAGGIACKNAISETAACNVGVACGVMTSCLFGPWSEWLGWLGGGVQKSRTRVVQTLAAAGGQACNGRLQETQAWDVKIRTPVNCLVTTWSVWNVCDKTCDGGQTFRHRSVAADAKYGGLACSGDLKETKECNAFTCSELHSDLNCKMSEWSKWSTCAVSCGVGSQTRTRTVLNQAKQGGTACIGPLEVIQACTAGACAISDCQMSIWGAWSSCTASCGEGNKRRQRGFAVQATPGGTGCGVDEMEEVQRCGRTECPKVCVDGFWTAWGEWSVCTKSCSGGYRTHTRSVGGRANDCGKAVQGYNFETQSCNSLIKCDGDEDCQLSAWSTWSSSLHGASFKKCGTLDYRSRSVKQHGEGHGMYCGTAKQGESLTESAMSSQFMYGGKCGITEKIDCKLGTWSTWGVCSSTCENGNSKRERQVSVHPSRTGVACKGHLSETIACNEKIACSPKVDCKFTAWGEWGNCTKCTGQKTRVRQLAQAAMGGGRKCDEDAVKEIRRCPKNCGAISKYFCIWSAWSAWGMCDVTPSANDCGSGTRTRRMVLGATEQQPSSGEYAALAKTKEECAGQRTDTQDCNAGPCGACVPKDCILGPWLGWTMPNCEGICTRTRGVAQKRNECGKPCVGSLNSTMSCPNRMAACEKKNCELSSWGEWTTCQSVLGQKYRWRSVKRHPMNDGQPCIENMNQTAPCLQKSDMVDCVFEEWGTWSACSATCNGGHKERVRKVRSESSHGGSACSGLTGQSVGCNKNSVCDPGLNSDCVLAAWGLWSACNVSQAMQSYRWRHILVSTKGSGKPCNGDLHETKSCAELGAVDCKFTEWNPWTPCSTTCFGGQQQTSRSIASYGLRGGKTCKGRMILLRPCQTKNAAGIFSEVLPGNCKGTACQLSDWVSWTPCAPACGNGQKERKRFVKVPPGPGGDACPGVLGEVASCSKPPCSGDVDCKWADWQMWQSCVPAIGPCGIGSKRRTRGFVATPIGAGRQCPPRIREELVPQSGCKGQVECCRDGKWGVWAAWGKCSVTCGGGTQTRARSLAAKETWCGKPPFGSSTEHQPCNPQLCGMIDCEFTAWTAWAPKDACSSSCSEGHAERTRSIRTHAHGGGQPCVGSTSELERCPHDASCTTYIPPSRDCVVSEWSVWSLCSTTCSKGYKEHSRTVKVAPSYDGKACPKILQELRACNAGIPCSRTAPVACVWSAWTQWTVCSGNEQRSSRGHLVLQAHGGSPCVGAQMKVRPCGACANSTYSCDWGQWADWQPCTATCGTGGSRTRERKLTASAEPQMDRLYDNSLPKLTLLSEEVKPKARQAEEMLSFFALGCMSIAVAFAGRSFCLRRRDGAEDCQPQGSFIPVASHGLLEGSAME